MIRYFHYMKIFALRMLFTFFFLSKKFYNFTVRNGLEKDGITPGCSFESVDCRLNTILIPIDLLKCSGYAMYLLMLESSQPSQFGLSLNLHMHYGHFFRDPFSYG